MCELLGVSSNKQLNITDYLKTFYSHSTKHPNGWGIVLLDEMDNTIKKEAIKAEESLFLNDKLSKKILSSRCIAHIRRATIGHVDINNTHPFEKTDMSGRKWILAHNGTIFDGAQLKGYTYKQVGTSDSERLLLYIVDEINKQRLRESFSLAGVQRIKVVENVINQLAENNKLNLLIYDEEYLYVHKNEEKSLYQKKVEGGVVFSTVPLDEDKWDDVAENRLLVYKDGNLIYEGIEHNFTYVEDEEQMRLLFLAYSEL